MRLSHVLAFDDAPFDRAHRGDVPVVGVLYAGLRLDGVYLTRVRRDGRNATAALAAVAKKARLSHVHVLLLQGIALAGFNVIDVAELQRATGRGVLVVARRRPNLEAIREALLGRVPGGARKWRLIVRAGEMEPLGGLWVQRAGLARDEAAALLQRTTLQGALPEPIRVAHLIAGAIGTGESRGRA